MEKAQHPVEEFYCNISSISEIESIQIVPAKWYNGFFSLVHDSWATECNQYLKCCLSAHEAHCFTFNGQSQMCLPFLTTASQYKQLNKDLFLGSGSWASC